MMTLPFKTIILFYSIISCLAGFSQQKQDTIILKRGEMVPASNKVFIDPNASSKYYKELSDFSHYDKDYFAEGARFLKDTTKRQAKANKVPALPKKWLPLELYKGHYYIYDPCDGIFDYRVWITDKFICETDARGMHPAAYNSITMVNATTFINPEINYDWHESNLTINIIDAQKGIAVFSTKKFDDKSTHHRLMVDADKISLFPLIKNDCPGGKEMEFDFEKPDFQKLLNAKK